jgi:hypothetical protein
MRLEIITAQVIENPALPPKNMRHEQTIGLKEYLNPQDKCALVDLQLQINAINVILDALKNGPWE